MCKRVFLRFISLVNNIVWHASLNLPEVHMVEKVSKDSVQFIRSSILLIGNNIYCFCLNREKNMACKLWKLTGFILETSKCSVILIFLKSMIFYPQDICCNLLLPILDLYHITFRTIFHFSEGRAWKKAGKTWKTASSSHCFSCPGKGFFYCDLVC